MKKNTITGTCLLLGLVFTLASSTGLSASWWSDTIVVTNETNVSYKMAVHQDENAFGDGDKWTYAGPYPKTDKTPGHVQAKISDDCETAVFGVYVDGVNDGYYGSCEMTEMRSREILLFAR